MHNLVLKASPVSMVLYHVISCRSRLIITYDYIWFFTVYTYLYIYIYYIYILFRIVVYPNENPMLETYDSNLSYPW